MGLAVLKKIRENAICNQRASIKMKASDWFRLDRLSGVEKNTRKYDLQQRASIKIKTSN